MSILYRHTQLGRLTLAIGVPVMLVAAVLAFRDAFAGGMIVSVVAAFILLSLFSLTTIVSETDVQVWFGVGLIRRRIALTRITSAEAVRNHWIYGWGISSSQMAGCGRSPGSTAWSWRGSMADVSASGLTNLSGLWRRFWERSERDDELVS